MIDRLVDENGLWQFIANIYNIFLRKYEVLHRLLRVLASHTHTVSIAWFPDPKMKIVSSFTRPSQAFCFCFVCFVVLFCFVHKQWVIHFYYYFIWTKIIYMLHKMSVSNDGGVMMTIFWVKYPLNIDELLTQLFLWFTNNFQHIAFRQLLTRIVYRLFPFNTFKYCLNIFNLKWYYVACTFTFKCIIYMHKLIHCTTLLIPGPCRDLWRGRCSKYKRGTWNTAFNRAVLLADICIKMDASVLIQQQMPWRRFEKATQNRKYHFKFNVKDIFLHLLILLWNYIIIVFVIVFYRVWWFCCCKHVLFVVIEKKIPVLIKIEFYSNPVLKLFIFEWEWL